MKSKSFLTLKWFFIALVTLIVFTFGYSLTGIAQEPPCPNCPVDPCGYRGLIAGNYNDQAGRLYVCNDDNYLYVSYYVENWLLSETHLAIASSLEGIPTNKKGNPTPGQFPYHSSHEPPLQYDCYTYKFKLEDYDWTPGTALYIAAHAVVYCEPFEQGETAWAWGPNFPVDRGKPTWAMYTMYWVK